MKIQNEIIREIVQKNIPDKKVRTVWFLAVDIQNNILYGVSGNNNKFFAVAKVTPAGEVEIIRWFVH